ncbi:MAG: IS200/IS605 family transposase [Halobacteriovoraceae bacterium]|nr:IS200/IS605 family transposase [Halobacteriovoraceae bacterium]MCB9061680.1 IS200/IS605 family transposase [Halobacteriovoraceae bacterium]MCB9062812.1 IS200/IS605 family transposase [Halobacteriovoraceae bacterium]
MSKSNLKSHYHCVYNLQYHLVLVTKYRRKCFTKEILKDLEDICHNVCEKWSCVLSEFGGEEDHIHLLIQAHPAMDLSRLVNNLKTVTSRLIKKKHQNHFKKFYWKPALWTRAYCLLTTGGTTIETIRRYIEKQGQSSPEG